MIGEILATGDEIRTGALIDSNSAFIAEKLEEAGVHIARHHCVGDDLNEMVAMVKEIARRADLAVVTGGLGPTADDRTAEAAAKAKGVPLVTDPLALKSIEDFFNTRHRKLTDINRKQAKLPEGSECLCNPVGTAPGFKLMIEGCSLFFLPGVPHEMRHMLTTSVLPRIFELFGNNRDFNLRKTISTFGLPESLVAERLSGFENAFGDVQLGLRAKFPEIQIKLYTSGSQQDKLRRRLTAARSWIGEKLGEHIFSDQQESMQAVLGSLLQARNENLAVAESCTGGLISHMLTEVSGSSGYFLFSGVTYSNQAKESVLGVSPATLRRHGAVHEQTAIEMAQGARQIAGATYGLSTSGIAGPDGGTGEKPVGTVCIGLATPQTNAGFRFTFPNFSRTMNKQLFAMTALDLLRRHLLGFKSTQTIYHTVVQK